MSDAESQVAALRTRLASLEREHAEETARLHAALAGAQERAYWLDRWHIDLNRWMVTPAGERFRAGVRGGRALARAGRRAKRSLSGRSGR